MESYSNLESRNVVFFDNEFPFKQPIVLKKRDKREKQCSARFSDSDAEMEAGYDDER